MGGFDNNPSGVDGGLLSQVRIQEFTSGGGGDQTYGTQNGSPPGFIPVPRGNQVLMQPNVVQQQGDGSGYVPTGQISAPPTDLQTGGQANNGGQWRPVYGGDVGTTFVPGQQQQGGQYRPVYGGDVGTTYRPGQQQNPPGYDGTMAAGGPQPRVGPEGVLPGGAAQQGLPGSSSGEGLPEPAQPTPQRSAFAYGIAGGTGAYLLSGPIPNFLNKTSEQILQAKPELGTRFFGENSWLAKNNAELATRVRSGLDTAPTTAAQWWKGTYVKPPEPVVKPVTATAPVEAAPTGATGAGATSEVLSDAGAAARTVKIGGYTADMTKAGQFFAKPGVQTFLKGAAIAGGTVLADHLTPGDDSYGFASVGVPVALAMPGDFKTKLMVAGGSLAAGKIFNAVVPASEHPGLHNFLAPNLTDTALMTGALFLPVNGEAKLAAVGGSYALGRMAKLDSLPAGGLAVGVGLGTYALTHNAQVSVLAGVGSFVGSRILHYI